MELLLQEFSHEDLIPTDSPSYILDLIEVCLHLMQTSVLLWLQFLYWKRKENQITLESNKKTIVDQRVKELHLRTFFYIAVFVSDINIIQEFLH